MSNVYDQDGLRSIHNHEFMSDPAFLAAYGRGIQAVGGGYGWHWRVYTGLWAAATAAKLPGDFIEFGVNRGFLSSAIMQFLDWNATGRTFYLLDTFTGVDLRYVSAEDLAKGVVEQNEKMIKSGFYTLDVEPVRRNFAEWPNVRIIVGPVPETLPQIDSRMVAFVHIDMNCAPPRSLRPNMSGTSWYPEQSCFSMTTPMTAIVLKSLRLTNSPARRTSGCCRYPLDRGW